MLLGSGQLLLLDKIRESLAGRCLIAEVWPLILPELMTTSWGDSLKQSFLLTFLTTLKLPSIPPAFNLLPNHANRQKVFEYYLRFGGYPALVNDKLSDEERDIWLHQYVITYLERDIRDLADFRSMEPFLKLQKLSALLTGQLLNYSSLGQDIGVTSKTAARFVQYLSISYQAILLQPWTRNKLKRLSKTPKLHYLDPGVLKAVLQKKGDLTGFEFESAIVAEIYKQCKTADLPVSFYHLRSHSGLETDLLLELEQGYVAFEIKMTQKVKATDARHLQMLKQILDKPLLQGFVVSLDNDIQSFGDNITALPAAMLLT